MDSQRDARTELPVFKQHQTCVVFLSCSIASPDNLALIPEQQVLIIGEDTSNHQVR